jgi:hypothetical protein
MNGFTFLGGQIIGQIGTEWTLNGIGDLNGDGKADLLFRDTQGNVLESQMNGFSFAASQAIAQVGADWSGCFATAHN